MMKLTNILLWLCVVVALVVLVDSHAFAEVYPLTALVIGLDYDNDMVEVVDFNGNVWAFDGCDDWFIGDICAMIMDDNNTPIIYDDAIIMCRYNGWIESWIENFWS